MLKLTYPCGAFAINMQLNNFSVDNWQLARFLTMHPLVRQFRLIASRSFMTNNKRDAQHYSMHRWWSSGKHCQLPNCSTANLIHGALFRSTSEQLTPNPITGIHKRLNPRRHLIFLALLGIVRPVPGEERSLNVRHDGEMTSVTGTNRSR